MNQTLKWWGSWQIEPGETRGWKIGPLDLQIERLEHELRIGHAHGPDPVDPSLELSESPVLSDQDDFLTERYPVNATSHGIQLSPMLADRPVVTRPESAFTIPAFTDVLLFVSTPVWVALQPEGLKTPVCELPTYRPSDTWFGASTMDGTLAYASKTACRLSLDELPRRPHRAITPIRIFNRVASGLKIERILVPVPHLVLFDSEDQGLWTQAISLSRKEERGGLAELEIERDPPDAVKVVAAECPARERREGRLIQAFQEMF